MIKIQSNILIMIIKKLMKNSKKFNKINTDLQIYLLYTNICNKEKSWKNIGQDLKIWSLKKYTKNPIKKIRFILWEMLLSPFFNKD